MKDYMRGLDNDTFTKVMNECISKCEGVSDKDWQDIVEEYNLGIHRDVLRKAFSAPMGGYSIYKYLEENNTDDSELEKLNEKIRELKIERNKLNVERMENNKTLRDYSRVEMRFEQVENAIKSLNPIIPPVIKNIISSKKEAILPITDQHYGKNVLIKGLKGEIINEYNENIFETRMWELLNNTVAIIDKENIETVHTLLLGDALEGVLRQSTLMQLQNGLIDQTMQYAEFMANWFNELSRHCIVDIHYTLGNHSECRVLNSKSGDFPQENMERIIMFYLKTRLKDNPNVIFNDSVAGFVYLNCLGVNVLGSHGKEKNIATALREYSNIYKEDINILITGHLHHNSSVEIGVDTEVIRVRSLCGVDDYAIGLRKTSNAGTSMLIIEEGRGKTITYDIKIK